MPGEYGFPFEPYETQEKLMKAISACIADSKVGFFESPTGTGKSLSVICSMGYWIKTEEKRILDALAAEKQAKKKAASGDDWLANILGGSGGGGSEGGSEEYGSAAAPSQQAALDKYNDMKKRLVESVEKHRIKADKYRPIFFGGGSASGEEASASGAAKFSDENKDSEENNGSVKGKEKDCQKKDRRKGGGDGNGNGTPDDADFVLAHYDSDDEKGGGRGNKQDGVMADDSDDDDKEDDNDDAGMRALRIPQLLYCSRTHSQVAQFVNEIKKTVYRDLRCVTLGSRRTLCINADLAQVTSDKVLSERCLELAKSKSKPVPTAGAGKGGEVVAKRSKHTKTRASTGPCPHHKAGAESAFGYAALNRVRDIEELAVLGRELNTCPYYGTRRAVQRAHVVCMPYNLLMNADARAAMGIHLKGSVVVIDEAHNIVDAVNSIHSADVSSGQLEDSVKALDGYIERFKGLLGGKNLYYLHVLRRLLGALRDAVRQFQRNAGTTQVVGEHLQAVQQSTAKVMPTNEFVFGAKLDDINIFKLQRHITATNLERKIGGYGDTLEKRAALAELTTAERALGLQDRTFGRQTAALRNVLQFVSCLKNEDEDGRVVMQLQNDVATPKATVATSISPGARLLFRLMNPASHFAKVVAAARSVVLLGGTMQPFSLLTSSLVPRLSPAQQVVFSCDHVVPCSNVSAIAIATGPNGRALDFRHASKSDPHMLLELFCALSSICLAVPFGKVVFFTSYAYMESVLGSWTKSGLLSKLKTIQPVFVEPRGTTGVEKVWTEYSQRAGERQSAVAGATGSGALLLCVMGGKMSEGINFSDHLARCVICVGMPYPDSRDPVLAEQLRHADVVNPGSSRTMYEGMCMRSVNQSIGRSIRHANDFASIVLLDGRYAHDRVASQLPGWIRNSLTTPATFAVAQTTLQDFFRHKTVPSDAS